MDNISLDFPNGLFYQRSVQKTETTVGSFKHEEISYRKLCGCKSTARAEGRVLKLGYPGITPGSTELTYSGGTNSEVTTENMPETRLSANTAQQSGSRKMYSSGCSPGMRQEIKPLHPSAC